MCLCLHPCGLYGKHTCIFISPPAFGSFNINAKYFVENEKFSYSMQHYCEYARSSCFKIGSKTLQNIFENSLEFSISQFLLLQRKPFLSTIHCQQIPLNIRYMFGVHSIWIHKRLKKNVEISQFSWVETRFVQVN